MTVWSQSVTGPTDASSDGWGTVDIMEDMDEDLLGLLRNWLDSFLKWELIRFLYNHPDTAYQVDELARRIHRDQIDLAVEASTLVAAGIVDCQWAEGQPAFALAADPAARRLVARFMQACEDRCFRMKAIYHVLQKMRP